MINLDINKYFQIVVDGTRMMKLNERHCKHCLKEVHNKGQENGYTRYYRYVLEAKLVGGEIVISIDSEFVENEDENVLYYALKAYNCGGVECLFKRVRSFKMRMLFMSASAVEEEAHALAAELYEFLES